MDQVFADPQVQHLAMTTTVDGGDGEPIEVLRPPLTFSDTPTSVRRGVPPPGAHTREVLAELGYDDSAIDTLIADGAAATEAKLR
jgi:crotonobetainyl-CoA:carnitine CoA-transferase CaiB-like acyl-CoA transferase